ncbi:hypothetical protein J4G33_11965 [Actinotalea sp. BY-33]|uniref:Uncharacterized protein n=1 Tax=Actinotalea soli TaxID=2819234 RepID=A0A939LR68_9CELL|nr:hypothetical protein [Actinotalea soli]MBO1752518.1 hypothetical protein [Actinotalea soli]
MSEIRSSAPTSREKRDTVESLAGWVLLIGGVCAAILWVPIALFPGGFIMIDAPPPDEALRVGVWSGTAASSLLLLAATGVVLGVGVLLRGRAGLNRGLAWVGFGVAGVAALTQQVWLLGAGALVALALVVVVLRRLDATGASPRA